MEAQPFLGHGRRQDRRLFFCCIFALKFCVQLNTALLELPLIRLVEHAVCKRDGPDGVEEGACKVPAVQDRSAYIIGYKSAFDALPCILTAWFYGSLSNSRGRRLAMLLSNTGQFLSLAWIVFIGFFSSSLPVESVWVSSAFLLVGGGMRQELAMQYTSFCDMTPLERRIQFLSVFHAMDGISGLLGYPISSALLNHRLWAPFGLAIAVFLAKYALLWYTPETSPYLTGRAVEDAAVLEPNDSDSEVSATEHPAQPAPKTSSATTLGCWWDSLSFRIRPPSLRTLFGHRYLNFVFASFAIKRIGFASLSFASQYASEILNKKLFETFWLRAYYHLGILLALSIFLPLLTRNLLSPTKDIWVIRGSLVDLMVGFLTLWRGHSLLVLCLGLALCGLGEGLEVGLQALGSHIVGEADQAIFFSFASVLGVAGELLAGPLMAGAYAFRDQQKRPLGYCFLFSVVLFSSLFFSSYLVRTSRLKR